MERTNFTLGIFADDPYVSACAAELDSSKFSRTGNCRYLGYSAEIFAHVISLMKPSKFEIKKILPVYGKLNETGLETGFWSGAFGLVQGGEIDTFPLPLLYTEERLRDFDFAYPLSYPFASGFLHQKRFKLKHDGLFKMFTLEIWLAFIGCVLVTMASYSFGQYALGKAFRSKPTPRKRDRVWTVFTLMMDQFNSSTLTGQHDSVSARMNLGCFGILIVFIISLYQSDVLSAKLAQSRLRRPFEGTESLAELVGGGQFRMVDSPAAPYYWSRLKYSSQSAFVKMRGALRRNPPLVVDGVAELEALLNRDGTAVAPISKDHGLQLMKDNCNLMFTEDRDFDSIRVSYIFRKGSPLTSKFSEVLNRSVKFAQQIIFASERSLAQQVVHRCRDDKVWPSIKPGMALSFDLVESDKIIPGTAALGFDLIESDVWLFFSGAVMSLLCCLVENVIMTIKRVYRYFKHSA